MSLRGRPVEQEARLPDGRRLTVRVGVPDDPYIPRRQIDTVVLELFENGRVAATVNTILGPSHTSEALRLAREVVAGLEAGELSPTAAAIEPLADRIL